MPPWHMFKRYIILISGKRLRRYRIPDKRSKLINRDRLAGIYASVSIVRSYKFVGCGSDLVVDRNLVVECAKRRCDGILHPARRNRNRESSYLRFGRPDDCHMLTNASRQDTSLRQTAPRY